MVYIYIYIHIYVYIYIYIYIYADSILKMVAIMVTSITFKPLELQIVFLCYRCSFINCPNLFSIGGEHVVRFYCMAVAAIFLALLVLCK